MRKTASIILLLCITLSLVFAASNEQKIYSVDSSVYKNMVKLYLATGHAMPSTTGPWSGDELIKMLNVIDINSVPEYLKETYDSLQEALTAEPGFQFMGGGMELNGILNLDLYAHTYDGSKDTAITRTDKNTIEETAFAGRKLWWFGKDLTKNTPFFELDWETYLGNNFYTFFNAYLSNSVRGAKEVGSTKLNSNIPTLQNFELDAGLLDINFPNRAFASIGGDGWNVQIGRDRLNWGSGTTGNLVLSDNFPYHDMARFTTYSKAGKFKYTYLLSFFPSKYNYYATSGEYMGNANNDSSNIPLQGIYFYAAHRFEGRVLDDKLSITVTDAITYDSPSGNITFTSLCPMYFMHNAYIPSNTNSTLAFEINYTPLKGLGIYAQMLLDNFAMPGFETSPGPNKDEDVTPDAKAYLVGAKYITNVLGGTLTVNPEFVYVQPFTYLRDPAAKRDSGLQVYGLDYIAAVRYRLFSYNNYTDSIGKSSDILYDEYVIGYTYGPDSLVANLSATWEKDKLTLGGRAFFMMHGTHDLWTVWQKVPANTTEEDYKKSYSGITSKDTTSNYRYDVSNRDSIWYTLDIGLNAKYDMLDNLSFNVAVDFVNMNNIFNVQGQDAFDFQLIFGVTYRPF